MAAPAKSFVVDAVLFDMDGTLTDSIGAVEAAWGKVAQEIGQSRKHVIAATHGKRAVDNLAHFKPHIKAEDMEKAVQEFEESILYFADAYNTHGPGSRKNSVSSSRRPSMTANTLSGGFAGLTMSNQSGTISPDEDAVERKPSFGTVNAIHRPSFGAKLGSALRMSAAPQQQTDTYADTFDDDEEEDDEEIEKQWQQWASEKLKKKEWTAWQMEAAAIDRSVQILPGVKKMMDSLPKGRYAVATSGAKTYAYGCMTRVGITPPEVTITADDKRLKAGKPAPDPFLLAAECLGFDCSKCLVFEDSPSGIKAGVASGATVIAVCTSHDRAQIENCGAHYIVENMEKVDMTIEEDGRLKFSVHE